MKPPKESPAFRLRCDEPPGAGIRRVMREQMDAACHALQTGGDPIQAVHNARKALKKARATLRLVAPEFDPAQYKAEMALLRNAARQLGPLRDANVQIKTLDAVIQAAQWAPGEFAALRAALEQRAGDSGAGAAQPIRRAVKLLTAARSHLRRWPLASLEMKDLFAEIRRTYRRGRRALATYRRKPGAETFHGWRKRVKELWYQLRLVGDHLPARGQKCIQKLNQLAQMAGDAHDLSVLRDHLEGAAGPGVQTALMIGEIEARIPESYRAAVKKGERFYAAKPARFARGLIPTL